MTIYLSDAAQAEPVPAYYQGPGVIYNKIGKRSLDVVLVLLSLPFVLPFLALLALAICAGDGGQPFFCQKRLGRDGKVFTMWKLRSMVRNADIQLAAYLEADPQACREWETKQKLTKDPRVTRFGSLLRKTSLDELPQLLNVLTGDMSLVGPRPMLPEQRVAYPGSAYERMRPGVTGLWQISDRNLCDFSHRAKYDALYFTGMSFTKDIKILAATIRVVYRGTGC